MTTLDSRLLPAVLSLVAGSVDVISFLGLNGLFVSHITGNLVILAVRIVNGGTAPIALILSVPIFILVLGLTKLFVFSLTKRHYDSLLPLLLLQFLLLAGFLALCVTAQSPINPNAANMILAGMFGVSAMAVQNALVQLSLPNTPATAVMTTNITRLVMNMGEALLGAEISSIAAARQRARALWPTIAGFIIGCAIGAVCEANFGLWALILPTSIALFALLFLGRRPAETQLSPG